LQKNNPLWVEKAILYTRIIVEKVGKENDFVHYSFLKSLEELARVTFELRSRYHRHLKKGTLLFFHSGLTKILL